MPNAKSYAKLKAKWSENPELYLKEKQRINEFIKNKYHTNEEFRLKCLEYQKKKTETTKNN